MIQKILPAGLWVLAFVCALFIVNAWQLELFAVSALIIFSWTVWLFSQDEQLAVPRSWVLRLLGAFWLLAFIGILHSEIVNISVMAFVYFSLFPLSFYVWAIKGQEKDFKLAIAGLLGIYTFLAIWALLQYTIFAEYFEGRAHHPLSDPNSLSALFSFAFIGCLGFLLQAKDKMQSVVISILTLLFFAGMMASGSRGAFFPLLMLVPVFFLCMRQQVMAHKYAIAGVVVGCLLLFLLTNFGIREDQNIFDRVVSPDKTDFSNNRIALWMATIGIIKEYPLMGTGFGTFFQYFPEYRLPNDRFGTYYAHNDPLQFWSELGVLAPILFYVLAFIIIGRTWAAVKACTNDRQKILILTPFFALSACFIHAHVTFHFYTLSILIMMGFTLAFWFQSTQKILNTSYKLVSFPKSFSLFSRIVLVALPFMMVGNIFMAYIAGEHYTDKARRNLVAGKMDEFADCVIKAQRYSLSGSYRAYLLAASMPLGVLEEAGDRLTPEQKGEMTQAAYRYMSHANTINPRSASALYYLGQLIKVGDAAVLPDTLYSSEEYYGQALKIDPLHIASRIALASLLESNGKQEEAYNIMDSGALYVYNTANATDYYILLAQYYLKAGQYEKQKKALKQAHNYQIKYITAQKKQTLRQFYTEP